MQLIDNFVKQAGADYRNQEKRTENKADYNTIQKQFSILAGQPVVKVRHNPPHRQRKQGTALKRLQKAQDDNSPAQRAFPGSLLFPAL